MLTTLSAPAVAVAPDLQLMLSVINKVASPGRTHFQHWDVTRGIKSSLVIFGPFITFSFEMTATE